MKRIVGIIMVLFIFISACSSPKPYYKTAQGKKKKKYYNEDIESNNKKGNIDMLPIRTTKNKNN